MRRRQGCLNCDNVSNRILLGRYLHNIQITNELFKT